MNRIRSALSRLKMCPRGATAIEYGLIAGLIAVVIVSSVNGTGDSLGNLMAATLQAVSDALQ